MENFNINAAHHLSVIHVFDSQSYVKELFEKGVSITSFVFLLIGNPQKN